MDDEAVSTGDEAVSTGGEEPAADRKTLAEEYLEKMFLFHKASHQQKIDRTIRGEICALYFIANFNKAVPGDISSFMDISSARIAAVLNNLEKKGYIVREIDSDDHRRTRLNLTREGNDFIKEIKREVIKEIEKVFNLLGEHDAQELVRITDKIIGLTLKL